VVVLKKVNDVETAMAYNHEAFKSSNIEVSQFFQDTIQTVPNSIGFQSLGMLQK